MESMSGAGKKSKLVKQSARQERICAACTVTGLFVPISSKSLTARKTMWSIYLVRTQRTAEVGTISKVNIDFLPSLLISRGQGA